MTLEELKTQWEFAKQSETIAKDARLQAESDMLDLIENLPDKGTTLVCNGLKVTTNLRVAYDQGRLMELYKSNKIVHFPFEKTFKPVSADLKYLEKNFPEEFKLVEACAETKPSKPSFKVEVAK